MQELGLGDTKITDAGLKHVKELKSLHTLDLRLTKVTDAGLKELKECKSLQRLTLFETLVTRVGLRELEAARPDLLLPDLSDPSPLLTLWSC